MSTSEPGNYSLNFNGFNYYLSDSNDGMKLNGYSKLIPVNVNIQIILLEIIVM